MTRRARIDSAAGGVAVMQAAVGSIAVPASVPLEKVDFAFWDSIIAARAKAEWSGHDLEIAAFMARAMGQLEIEQRLVRSEGSVVVSAGGSPMQNPRVSVVHGLTAQIKGYRQTLGVHSRATQGEARDVGVRRKAAKEIEAHNPLHDDLIGRPMGTLQ